jgi:REP element-mobilizing transposase RayT
MKFNPDIHHRRSIRLKDYDYSQEGIYFITICTLNHEQLFGDIIDEKMFLNEFGKIVNGFWLKIPENFPNVQLDEYIIMPNHIHGIITVGAIHELPLQNDLPQCNELPQQQNVRIHRRKMLLPKIIGKFKMQSAKQINKIRNTLGIAVWQRNYYKHIIRHENELNRIREYIVNNPLKWKLEKEYFHDLHYGAN